MWRVRWKTRSSRGFDTRVLAKMAAELARRVRPESPFAKEDRGLIPKAHWVEPTLVVQVGFGEWPGGALLRHPRFIGTAPTSIPGGSGASGRRRADPAHRARRPCATCGEPGSSRRYLAPNHGIPMGSVSLLASLARWVRQVNSASVEAGTRRAAPATGGS
ncbi:MAG: hypothetical protein ACREMH_10685 [Gemmatimonadales bacterium]